jgi:predicted ATPase
MLSLPNDGRYPTLELTPEKKRQKTLEALTAQLEALSQSKPVLMIFEDVHWTDPTSLETLGRTVDRLRTLAVLLISTYRPEFEAPWIGRPYVTAINLNRLGEREIAEMIDGVTGNKILPNSVRQEIIERTDGIPLFVEEMTKAVLEAENEGDALKTAAVIPSPAIAVPASLHASLIARLDRLGPAKEVAQIGAVIGREFSHALLAAVALKTEEELQSALDALTKAGLLFRQGLLRHATYLFKHALVQDAAYGTLLREPRRALHGRIAEAIETQFADVAESRPELVARHCTEAGLIEKAAAFWGKAGQRSVERSALVEAVTQLTRALDQIATLPSTPALRREAIQLQVAFISPLIHVKGYAAPETKAAVERAHLLIEQAEALGEPPEDPLLLFSVLHGFWYVNAGMANCDAALDIARQFLVLAEKQGAIFPLMTGHRLVGTSLAFVGDFTQGRAHLDRAIALYNPAAHRSLATRFSHDTRMSSLLRRSQALWGLGYPEAALADISAALLDARAIGQAATLFFALWGGCWIHTFCGSYNVANELVDELGAFADEKGAFQWKAFAMLSRGLLFAVTGKASDAVQAITAGVASYRQTGTKVHLPAYLAALSKAYADLGQLDDARRCIGEAMSVVETTKEKWLEAEVHRTAAEIALISPQPDPEKAQANFERALEIARKQQAKSWELRAAMSMARLWRDQGKPQQARDLLAPVYAWFTEGFDTLDLKQAKALLDELM